MTCDVSCSPSELSTDSSFAPVSATSFAGDDQRLLTAAALLAPGDRDPLALVPPSVSTRTLVRAVAAWDAVSLSPHEHSAVVFLRDGKEIGFLKPSGLLSVPLPESIRSVLLGMPTSIPITDGADGAIDLLMETPADVRCGAFLLRLSHVYRSVIACRSRRVLAALRTDIDVLDLPTPLADLYVDLLRRRATTFA